MDTKAKYGISKRHAILLFVQMILTIIGFAAQVGIMVFIVGHGLDALMLVSSITIILAFLAVFCYGIFGFKKSKIFYFVAIGLFMASILINNILPFRGTVQKIFLTLLFGSMGAFLFTQEKFKLSNIIIALAALFSLVFSIYSTITANVNSLGPVEENVLPVIMMYISIWTPVILSGVFGVSYLVREEKKAAKN